jgi:hypothetical protein
MRGGGNGFASRCIRRKIVRLEAATVLPSQRPPRHWRTRAEPLAAVWDAEVVPMLEGAPSLMAVTLLEELQRRHPERFSDSVLRTLQRRVGQWRAEHGGEREIYFAQEHPPGRLGLSDFTVADELDVSLGGLAFSHRLYQFALAHSGWRHVRVVLGGESFQSLADGVQDALWMAGGVPEEHRTDSLSAAFNNLAEREELTKRYHALCKHYGLRPTRNNTGVSHENGAIEARTRNTPLRIVDAGQHGPGSGRNRPGSRAATGRPSRSRDRGVRDKPSRAHIAGS